MLSSSPHFHKLLLPWIAILVLVSCDILSPDSPVISDDQDVLARFENADFVAANPEYIEAVQLAFWHEGGLTADPRTAWSFLKQRNAIRHKYGENFPEVEQLFTQPFLPGQISIAVDTTMTDQVADPESEFYAAVDPNLLPDSVSVMMLSIDRPYHRARLYFSKLYNPEIVAQAYRGLPGVFRSEPAFLINLGGSSVTPGLIDGQFYYMFSMSTRFTRHKTTVIHVKPEPSGLFRAEVVASGPWWTASQSRDELWDDRLLELIRKISRQYLERYYERYHKDGDHLNP